MSELRQALQLHAHTPVALIGFSWGAWLAILLSAHHPELVSTLLLIGTGPLLPEYLSALRETRESRLNDPEKEELAELSRKIHDPSSADRTRAFARYGAMLSKADSYDVLEDDDSAIEFRPEIYEQVWREADELRSSGELLRLAGRLQCSVVSIHGDYDPHPPDGVRVPLSGILSKFRSYTLDRCGHTPWIERYARDRFFEILEKELSGT